MDLLGRRWKIENGRWQSSILHPPFSIIIRALVALLLISATDSGRAQPATAKEYQVKAACLFNFVQFVEWPATAFSAADAPITIGVLGDDPFGAALETIVKGETINNRKLVIKRSRQVDDLKSCHVLFISKSEKGKLDQILTSVRDTNVLTVSETDQFTKRGGVINFYLDANKVRFEINVAAARRAGLKISSQLLKLGKVVEGEKGAEKSEGQIRKPDFLNVIGSLAQNKPRSAEPGG